MNFSFYLKEYYPLTRNEYEKIKFQLEYENKSKEDDGIYDN